MNRLVKKAFVISIPAIIICLLVLFQTLVIFVAYITGDLPFSDVSRSLIGSWSIFAYTLTLFLIAFCILYLATIRSNLVGVVKYFSVLPFLFSIYLLIDLVVLPYTNYAGGNFYDMVWMVFLIPFLAYSIIYFFYIKKELSDISSGVVGDDATNV